MQEHMLKHHSVGCHKCRKLFTQNESLTFAYLLTTEKMEVPCQNCKFSFPTQKDMKNTWSANNKITNKDTDNYEDSDSEHKYIDVCRLCGVVLYSYHEVEDHHLLWEKCSV